MKRAATKLELGADACRLDTISSEEALFCHYRLMYIIRTRSISDVRATVVVQALVPGATSEEGCHSLCREAALEFTNKNACVISRLVAAGLAIAERDIFERESLKSAAVAGLVAKRSCICHPVVEQGSK
jgi:hypothetical protein